MPGIVQFSIDTLLVECKEVYALGIPAILIFGIPAEKDAVGSDACNDHGIVQEAVRAIKKELPGLIIITDVCLCEFTDHGHCGIVEGDVIVNDATVALLAREAVSHAAAGADIVAPSDMMDGRVAAIRRALDADGNSQTPILSYASKFASAFYGPFREAADSAPQFGDRKTYQMDGANLREALREIDLDIEEGGDIILMEPAMPYLDVVRAARERVGVPIGAYQVSGEYSMLQAAFEKGLLERDRAILESLVSMRRAGADFIVTYFAKDAAKLI